MRPALTMRQQETLDFIAERIAAGKPPTYRDIGAKFSVNVNAVTSVLNSLVRKGYVTKDRTSRSIRIKGANRSMSQLLALCCNALRYHERTGKLRAATVKKLKAAVSG